MGKALQMMIGVCASVALLFGMPGFPGEAAAAAKDPPKTPVSAGPPKKTSPPASDLSGTGKSVPAATKEDLPAPAIKEPLSAPVQLPKEPAPLPTPATEIHKTPEPVKTLPTAPASATIPSTGGSAPGVKHFEPVSPAAAPAASGADSTKKGEKPAGSAPADKNVGVPKVIPLSDQEKASIKQKFGKPEIESTRPTKTEGAAAAAPSPTPVRGDLLRPEDRIAGTAGGRPLSPKELGQMADKLERWLDALERTGPNAALGGLPDSTGRIPGLPGGPDGQGGDIMDRFDRTGPNLPGPTNVLTNPAGPMPDNNPLGGHTAQEMFEHQSGATSPGKEAGGGIKPPVASVKSEGAPASIISVNTYQEPDGTTVMVIQGQIGRYSYWCNINSKDGLPTIRQFTYYDPKTGKTTESNFVLNGTGEQEALPDLVPLPPSGWWDTHKDKDTKDKSTKSKGKKGKATVQTIDRENQRLPAEFYPTFREMVAQMRAASGKADPNVTTPREDDGAGGGSVDPGKLGGGWIKKPVPDDPGNRGGIVSPGSNVDAEQVRPQPVPAPIDPKPLDGQRPSTGTGE